MIIIQYGILVLMLLISLVSCNNNSNNSLGKDYYYMRKEDTYDIGYPSWNFIYKSDRQKKTILERIPSDVLEYEFNDKYIIAKQKYNKQFLLNELTMELSSWDGYYKIYNREGIIYFHEVPISLKKIHQVIESDSNGLAVNIDKFADSIISHNTYYKELLTPNKINYYIIDKDKDSVLGPLTKEEFEKVKKEKSIDLEFDEKK